MGPKSKIAKKGWEECNVCRCFFTSGDVRNHVLAFHGIDAGIINEENSTPTKKLAINKKDLKKAADVEALCAARYQPYGFINKDILHGLSQERPMKPDELSKLPWIMQDEMILLNPSVMALCKMRIGTTLLVWTVKGHKFAFMKAWPAKDSHRPIDVGLSKRMLSRLKCKPGDVLHLQSFQSKELRPAKEVTLVPTEDKPFYNRLEFINYFSQTMTDQVITVGITLFINYNGQQCEFRVGCVNGSERETESSSDIWDTCLRISALNVNDLQGPPCCCESTRPKLAEKSFYIHSETKIRISCPKDDREEQHATESREVSFEDVGGVDQQLERIRLLLDLPEIHNQTMMNCGLCPPRGILLFGPSGTGKTMIGQAVATAMKGKFLTINGAELYSKFYGETEKRLREVFQDAKRIAPSVIFIDEIDTLCPKRDGSLSQQEQRVVASVLTLMDNLPTEPENRVLVLAASNKPDALDSAMRRPGRLDMEIEIGVPTAEQRKDILQKHLRRTRHGLTEAEIAEIAKERHGFVGADLAAICSQAGLNAYRRLISSGAESCRSTEENKQQIMVTYDDMVKAAQSIKPSALREFFIEVPKVRWEDIGGQHELKRTLIEAVDWPLNHSEALRRMGITPSTGILMYGPPGCSKTLIAKALATESKLNFIAVKGSELFSKWVGESEKAIQEVFRKARKASPCILFFDEIDAVAPKREGSSSGSQVANRVLSQMLTEMDGLESRNNVIVVAATNRPDMIDSALLRPERLGSTVYVGLPDKGTRMEIFQIQFRKIKVSADVDVERLVARTEGYSGAETVAVCNMAKVKALEECMDADTVSMSHFELALQEVRPKVSKKMLAEFEKFNRAK